MKTPKEIVKIVLTELKAKKLLRESPEGDMNGFINELQSCITELSGLKSQVEGLISTNIDEEESSVLNLVNTKLNYISTTLNGIVTKATGSNSLTDTTEALGEADTSNGSVNMSVDNIVKKPDVVKKLESGNLTINAIGDDGKPLTEEEEVIEEGPKAMLKSKGKNPFDKYISGVIVTVKGWEDNELAENYLIQASVALLLRKEYSDAQLKAAAVKVIKKAYTDDFDYWTLDSIEKYSVKKLITNPEVITEDEAAGFLSGKVPYLLLEDTVNQNY